MFARKLLPLLVSSLIAGGTAHSYVDLIAMGSISGA